MTSSKTVWASCVLLALTLVRPSFAQEAPQSAPPAAPQQPSTEQPPAQQPLTQQPPAQQPPAQQPPAQQPPAQQPPAQQPPTQQPPAQQPPTQPPPVSQPPPGQQPPTQPADQAQQAPEKSDPDLRVDVLQPDFTLAALPTTLRLPRNKLSFRVTHRFLRPLGQGDVGDLLSNFFNFDEGAQIGLELRYGLLSGTQVGVYRTSDRTIEIFGQQSIMQEKADGHPLSIDALATIEGQNNLQENYTGAFGLLVSRKVAGILAAYAEPMFVANANYSLPGPKNTGMIGLGARVRIRPKAYIVAEITPRFAGYRAGGDQMSFGLEGRAGGHLFQVNFSNGLGTTLGQIARGGIDYNTWYIGFNISRKFF